MIQLVSQKELGKSQGLDFCHSCGRGFSQAEPRTKDHIPPESIFAKEHRNPPLILPAHDTCNQEHSVHDEVIGQLVAVARRQYPSPNRNRLKMKVYETDNSSEPMLGLIGTAIEQAIWSWVRGFHAALYREFLPADTRNTVHPPFWRANETGNVLRIKDSLSQESQFAERIRVNRLTQTLDRIETCSSKCCYECTWEKLDNGRAICVFALRLYDWEKLGDRSLPQRGCTGCYQPLSGKPGRATSATSLEFQVSSDYPLDPFAD